MVNREITSGKEAHLKLKAGVDKLANVVKSTLGPGGTNVILQRGHTQAITKDGVSVASEIWFADPIENIGAQIVKQVAMKTVEEAGDGTTTATVLAQGILDKGLETGGNLIDLKRGIDKAVKIVVEHLKAQSREVKEEEIVRIATISANGDEEIGKLVADAVQQVGLDGLVTVESSKSMVTESKKVEGMRWDLGYMSPYFVTNEQKMESFLEDPVVLIYDGAINSVREIMGAGKANIFDRYRSHPELGGCPLMVIANDFGAEFISTMAVNHQNKAIRCVLVQAPEFGEDRKQSLYDIAAMTNATVVTKDAGFKWSDVKPEVLGRCQSVRVTQWNTTIIGGHGTVKAQNRAEQLKNQMEDANEEAKHVLRRRIARLINGMIAIYVGGGSDIEVQEKKDRIDDALNATRAAISEGILPGGGVSLIRAQMDIDWGAMEFESESQKAGAQIIESVLPIPFKAIVENAGESPEKWIKEVENAEFGIGFNAKTLKMENLIDSGVIDPTKVVRLALENAASVSGMLLTTKSIVSNKVG